MPKENAVKIGGANERERERESKPTTQNGNVLIIALLIIGLIVGGIFVAYKFLHPSLPTPSSKSETTNTPTPTPSPENQPIQQDEKSKNNPDETPVSNGLAIKCLGADRKFFYTTQEICDAHTEYWTKVLGSFPTDPEEIIQCLGADGKYSTVPRKTCEDVNKFWADHPPSGTSSSNSSSSSSSSTSDITAPLTTDNTDSSWHTSNVTITLTCTDNSSGCDKTYYTTDGSTPTSLSTQGTLISLTSNGTYTIKYFSVDKSGNQEAVKTATNTVKIDKTAPTDPGTPTTTTPTNSTSQTWTWSAATDVVSGVVNYAWRAVTNLGAAVANGTTTLTTAATNFAEGIYNFFVKANDNAGNESGEVQGTATVDTTAPVTTDSGIDTSWHTLAVTVTLTCADINGSGCAHTYYTTDGTTPTTSSSTGTSFSISTDGTHTIKYFSVDSANNQESVKTATNTVKIDATAPSTPGTPSTISPNNDFKPVWTWTASTDSGSGLAATPYSVQWCGNSGFTGCDSNVSTSATNSFTHGTALSDGTWYFRVKSIDTAGNNSVYSANGSVVVDTIAPSIPGTPSTISPNNDFKPVWTWTASTDLGSGLANPAYSVQWSQDSSFSAGVSSSTTNTNTFTHITSLSAGTWYFRVLATDAVNNNSAYSSQGTVIVNAFLLNDHFSTDLAAGSVNNTLAEPGPGTRTLVDTESKVRILSGAAWTAAKSTPTNNDPMVTYNAQTRSLGRFLMGDFFLPGNRGYNLYIGWKSSSYPNLSFVSGNYVMDAATFVSSWKPENTSFHFAIPLRATGEFYLIRGGKYGLWRLIWVTGTNNVSSLTPAWGSTFPQEVAVDYIEVPQDTWYPRAILSDSFNRTDGVLGTTDGAGHAETGDGAGLVWSSQIGTWAVSSNKALASVLTGGAAIVETQLNTGNILFKAKLNRNAGNIGLVAKWVDANNYIFAYHDGTNVVLKKVIAGVTTQVASTAIAYSVNSELAIITDGKYVTVIYNKTNATLESEITDSALVTGQGVGFYTTDTGNTFDDAVAWARGNEGQYATLNSYEKSLSYRLFMPFGDSKTQGSGQDSIGAGYPSKINILNRQWREGPSRIAVSGTTIAARKAAIDTDLVDKSETPEVVLINLGANEVLSMPTEAQWKSDFLYILDALHTKWPLTKVYIMLPWRRNYDASCDTLASWISDIVSQRSSFTYLGPDERIFLKGSDNGATYTDDGVHPNIAGYQITAVQWLAIIGN